MLCGLPGSRNKARCFVDSPRRTHQTLKLSSAGAPGTARSGGAAHVAAVPVGAPPSVEVPVSHPYQLRLPLGFAKRALPGHPRRPTAVVLPHLMRSFSVEVGWLGPSEKPYHAFCAGWKEMAKVAGFKLGNVLRVTYQPISGSYSIVRVPGALCNREQI